MSVPNLEKIYFGDKIIDNVYGFDRTLYTATQPVPLPSYFVDFEDGTKGSYGTGSVTLNGISWSITEALIGSLASDLFFDTKSLRIRSRNLSTNPTESFDATMTQDLTTGVSKISFYYGRFGTDTSQPATYIEYSTDQGSTWTTVDTIAAGNYPSTLTLREITGLNISGNVRVRFRSDMASNQTRRFNIDNITITGI